MEVFKKEYPDGQVVYSNEYDAIHREDGPAIIFPNGREEWWINGNRHRKDGPAVIDSKGNAQYWLDGKEYSYTEWLELTTNQPDTKTDVLNLLAKNNIDFTVKDGKVTIDLN